MAGSSGLPVATQPDTSSPSAVPSSSASVTTFRVNAPSSSASPPSSGLYHHNYAHLPYWQNAWSTSLPPWASNGPTSAAQSQPYQYGLGRFSSHNHARHYPAPSPRTPTTNQPPSPPPVKFYKQWDAAIRSFLESVGLTQTLVGFQADMLVMNEDWEKRQVPPALETLVNDLSNLAQSPALENSSSANPAPDKRTLDDRKLDYFQPPNNSEARSQTTINRSISQFIAQNRSRNNRSNREEFLHSIHAQRREPAEVSGTEDRMNTNAVESLLDDKTPSCARTDAKPLQRDIQMKYDIAKNEDGPLRRTINTKAKPSHATPSSSSSLSPPPRRRIKLEHNDEDVTSERHPGLDERVRNIETHLAVRYVPSPPRSLASRIKFLEGHIMKLEKEYPPWAALHFNQPNRGWPPPPRQTPILVPSHLTSYEETPTASEAGERDGKTPSTAAAKGKKKSSLHRAVMEKLEVQKAMNDFGR